MNVLITGASRGIGFQLCKRFLENGHHVIATARNEKELFKLNNFETVQNLTISAGDLTDEKHLTQLMYAVDNSFMPLDILINNAGFLVNKPLMELTNEDIQHSFDVNYIAPLKLVQILQPYLLQAPIAHIVNIGSMGGFQGTQKFSGLGVYCGAKAALANLTECLAEELKSTTIKTNCLALGATETEMLQQAFPDFQAPISAEKMGEFIYDFAMNSHHYMNGKIIPVSLTS